MLAPPISRLPLPPRILLQSHLTTICHLAEIHAPPFSMLRLSCSFNPLETPLAWYTDLLRMLTLKTHVFFSVLNGKTDKLRAAQPPVRLLTGQERAERMEQWQEVALVLDMMEETVRALRRDMHADEAKRMGLEGGWLPGWKPEKRYWVIPCVEIDIERILEKRIPSLRRIVEEAIGEIESFGCERVVKKRKLMNMLMNTPGPWNPEIELRERVNLLTVLGKMEMLLDVYREEGKSYRRVMLTDVWSWGAFRKEVLCLINQLFFYFEAASLSFVDGLKERSYTVEQARRVRAHVDQLIESAIPILNEIEALEDSKLRVERVESLEEGERLRVTIETFREHLVMRRKMVVSWKMVFDWYCDTGVGFYGGALTTGNDDENLGFGLEWDEQDCESDESDIEDGDEFSEPIVDVKA